MGKEEVSEKIDPVEELYILSGSMEFSLRQFRNRVEKMCTDEAVRAAAATRAKVAADLETYRDTLLDSRGIQSPSWIGKRELQTFIDGLRSSNAKN